MGAGAPPGREKNSAAYMAVSCKCISEGRECTPWEGRSDRFYLAEEGAAFNIGVYFIE